ncbi:HAD family hydrolase [Arthrobacter sp. HY1533]|uniref:HAD family hydrolase n=1 Tax=Arthrobacter sp. HY1533 TaxID=2970919 RepID=UPI0022B9E2D3|nr:HAD hydrolase-like protein [Arthrobacter sp. HY1533]
MDGGASSLVISDVGGTILNTDDLHLAAWRSALAHYGYDREPHLSAIELSFAAGNDSFSTARSLNMPQTTAMQIAKRKRELAQVVQPVDINVDVMEFIASRGTIACAISHSEESWTQAMLLEAGVYDHFALVLGRTTNTPASKELMLRDCLEAFPDREEAIYIGNTASDRTLARQCGLAFISAQSIQNRSHR